ISSSSFQPTGDVVEGVRWPAVTASVLLSGDHFASTKFWMSGRSTRPVQFRPASHFAVCSSGTCAAERGSAGIHAPRTSESTARASFALIVEILGVGPHAPSVLSANATTSRRRARRPRSQHHHLDRSRALACLGLLRSGATGRCLYGYGPGRVHDRPRDRDPTHFADRRPCMGERSTGSSKALM